MVSAAFALEKEVGRMMSFVLGVAADMQQGVPALLNVCNVVISVECIMVMEGGLTAL